MVEIIKEYLDICDEEEFNHSNKEQAEYILGCCETWGMLPPTTKLSHMDANDNAWESENEEK